MWTNSSKFEDRSVLSRHLTSESGTNRPTSGTSTDWLSITYPMGNLASNLRRSMPSMNSSSTDNSAGVGAEQLLQRVGNVRHSSFSTESGAICQEQKQQNAIESEIKRCISSHSLSPSGSTILNSSRSVTASAGCDFVGAMSVVDTRQIKVFLKKREDSMTTVCSELSDTLSVGVAGGAQIGAIPPPPPQLVHAQQSIAVSPSPPSAALIGLGAAVLPRHSSRKAFRASAASEKRSFSTQSSVTSSLDSAKEEWLISNFDHSNSSQRVIVLPRPASIHIDNYEEETAMTPMSFSALSSPIPPISLSAWHSVSDLTPSARTMVPERGQQANDLNSRRGSTISAENGTDGTEKAHSPPSRQLPKRPQSQAGHRKSNYLGELVWQVDETVFCGGIESVQNRNLLCRLNIEYIVDLSGQEDDPMQLNSRHSSEFPCLCARRTAHSRMTMAMTLKDDSQQQMLSKETRPSTAETKAQLAEREQIIRYFETLIDLIRKARISQKKVLIHSLKGRNRAPAFVAAYLMHCNRITRVQAINRITKLMCSMRPGLFISDNLQRALMRWQFILGIRSESSRLDSQSLNRMFAVKRNAWN